MQHTLQISRKIDYGLRAAIYLASVAQGSVVPFREVAKLMNIPQDFLAKILKTLVDAGLVSSVRGARGGYALARPPAEISFLDVIEAVEGPIQVNVCLAEEGRDACGLSPACTMYAIWKEGQDRMIEVYRATRLDRLAMKSAQEPSLQPLHLPETPRPA